MNFHVSSNDFENRECPVEMHLEDSRLPPDGSRPRLVHAGATHK